MAHLVPLFSTDLRILSSLPSTACHSPARHTGRVRGRTRSSRTARSAPNRFRVRNRKVVTERKARKTYQSKSDRSRRSKSVMPDVKRGSKVLWRGEPPEAWKQWLKRKEEATWEGPRISTRQYQLREPQMLSCTIMNRRRSVTRRCINENSFTSYRSMPRSALRKKNLMPGKSLHDEDDSEYESDPEMISVVEHTTPANCVKLRALPLSAYPKVRQMEEEGTVYAPLSLHLANHVLPGATNKKEGDKYAGALRIHEFGSRDAVRKLLNEGRQRRSKARKEMRSLLKKLQKIRVGDGKQST